MRIESLKILNALRVRRFEVAGLADVMVVAGPNGVGKTRLLARVMQMLRAEQPSSEASAVIQATNETERSTWGKSALDLSHPADVRTVGMLGLVIIGGVFGIMTERWIDVASRPVWLRSSRVSRTTQ